MKTFKFTETSPENSSTNRTQSDLQVVDNDKPLSYNQWLQYIGHVGGSPEKTKEDYKKYVSNWSKQSTYSSENTNYKDQYITYLKQLTYSYIFTQDEKRIVNTVDYDNPYEVDTVTHIWAKRIKQLCEYIRKQREELKFQPTKYQQRCTTGGIETIIHNHILRYLEDEDIREEFIDELDQLDRIKNELRVEVTELYDLEEGYHNNNKLESSFTDTSRGTLASKYNNIDFDPYIFIDQNKAVENIISNYDITTNISIEDDQVINVPLFQENITVQDLPPNEFIDYTNSLDTLTIDTVKKLIQSSIGVDLHYTTTDESGAITQQGVLVKATNPAGNVLNRRNPSINIVSNNKTKIKNIQQIGGFFTPEKLGLLTFASLSPSIQIKTDQLEANTLYVYNDPVVYSSNNEEYISTKHPPLPIQYIENVRWMKSGKASDGHSGDLKDTKTLPKHYNYSSESEINTHSKYGISRFDDNYDFWTGGQSDIWSNSDIFQLDEIKNIPIESRQETLLVNKGQMYKWRCDVYGNEYAMFKNLRSAEIETDTIADECTKDKYLDLIVCEVVDGTVIKDILKGLPIYSMCLDGGSDQPTIDISENSDMLALAEQVTDKTWKCNEGVCEPGSRFASPGVLQGATETGFSPQCAFTHFINGSYFLPDICDESVLETSVLPGCRIVDGYSVEVPSRYNELDYYELSGTWHPALTGQSGDYFEISYDDLWDAGEFDSKCTTNFDISYKQNYSTKYIEPEQLYGTTDALSAEQETTPYQKTISSGNHEYGNLIIRDASSRYVSSMKSIMDNFINVIPDVSNVIPNISPREQLSNNMLDFDVIHDIIILYSENFMYMNKILYDYDSGAITPDFSAGLLIEIDRNVSIPMKHFYNEKTQEIIIGSMTYSDKAISGDIYSFFYPDKMYRMSTQSAILTPQRLNFSRELYILQNTILSVDLTSEGYITYNDQLNYYYITTGGVLQDFDNGDQFYIYQTRFTLDKDIPTAVTSQRPRIYYTSAINSTETESSTEGTNNELQLDESGLNYFDLSTYLNDSFSQDGFDYDTANPEADAMNVNWINNRLLKPSAMDHNLSFSPSTPTFTPLFAPDKVQTFYFNLHIDAMYTLANNQDQVYKVEARFHRPDISPDHIDTIFMNRSPLPNWSELDMSRLANKDDLTDPRQHVLYYEYNFRKSPEQCPTSRSIDECISVTDWDNLQSPTTPSKEVGELYKFIIILHTMSGKKYYYPYKFILRPFTAGTCLSDIKITNVASYVDSDYHESTLLILESQFPRFVSPVVLRTEPLEKITFDTNGLKTTTQTNTETRSIYIKQETVTNIFNNN